MNEAKDQVWRNLQLELRRRRHRRRAAGAIAVIGLLVAAVWTVARPGFSPARAPVVAAPVPATPEPANTPPQLAVFVRHGSDMRLELVDAGTMADAELALSLEPVVWEEHAW